MSIRPLIMILFALLATGRSIAQTELTITKTGNEFATKLIAEKVDTMITYNYPDYRSEPWEHAYVIWKKDGKTRVYIDYIKQIEAIDDSAAAGLWGFLHTNLTTIRTEKVKPFTSMMKVKGKNVVDDTPNMDSEWWKCSIYTQGDLIKISEGESAFIKKQTFGDGKVKENINYEYNNKLKRKLLVDLLDDVLEMVL